MTVSDDVPTNASSPPADPGVAFVERSEPETADASQPGVPAADWVAEVSEDGPTELGDQPPMPPHMEAAYRRASRRLVITAVVLGLLVLSAAGFIGATAMTRRLEGARKLDRAQSLVEGADKTILDLDEVVRSEASTELANQAQAAAASVPAAEDALREAIRLIDEAHDSVTEDEQRRSELLRDAAEARLEMLAPANAILMANAKAGRALGPAQHGWQLVLEAEKLSDEAVAEYNKLTKESVNRSTLLSGQAESALDNARRFMSEAATAFPEAGFERYVAFIDGKRGLLALSKQSNSAWLAGKIPEANALIKRYNDDEQRVIEMARTLPASPGKAVADAYEKLVSEHTERYYEARKAATRADAAIERF